MELELILAGCSRSILEQVEYLKTNKKIKTVTQKKRCLLDTWNHAIDIAVSATDNEQAIAILRGCYGLVTSSILKELKIEECYELVKKWAMRMVCFAEEVEQ